MAQRKTVKEYAHEALDCFDRMAMPEIKNRVMSSIWGFLRKYIKKTIDKKPDAELHEKLFEIYKTLNPLFESLQTTVQQKISNLTVIVDYNKYQTDKKVVKSSFIHAYFINLVIV